MSLSKEQIIDIKSKAQMSCTTFDTMRDFVVCACDELLKYTTTTDGMKDKFLVLNRNDIEKYLNKDLKCQLDIACMQITACREIDGKSKNNYLVINTDEPYANQVMEIMKSNGHWG